MPSDLPLSPRGPMDIPDELKFILLKRMKTYLRGSCTGVEISVLGSVAIDHFVMSELEFSGATSYYKYLGMYPGGSGANVASSLSRSGRRTALFTKFAVDPFGLILMKSLLQDGVCLSCSEIGYNSTTVQCLISLDEGYSSIHCLINEKKSALSLEHLSPEAIQTLRGSRAIYVGEVFLEIAEQVLRVTQGDKLVIFRPSPYALALHPHRVVELINYGPLVVLNFEKMKMFFKAGIYPPDILKRGARALIVTMGEEGTILYEKVNEVSRIPAPRVNSIDTTGAGDSFSAALIYALLNGSSLDDAVRFAVTSASISTLKIGGGHELPTYLMREILRTS